MNDFYIWHSPVGVDFQKRCNSGRRKFQDGRTRRKTCSATQGRHLGGKKQHRNKGNEEKNLETEENSSTKYSVHSFTDSISVRNYYKQKHTSRSSSISMPYKGRTLHILKHFVPKKEVILTLISAVIQLY